MNVVHPAAVSLIVPIMLLSCSGPSETSEQLKSSAECGSIPEGSTTMAFLPELGFCIDRTEVTRKQYQRWLDKGPSVAKETLPDVCRGKSSFVPPTECMTNENVCRTGCDNQPMVCVDWCDAHAYCNAMGKRLCGAIGGGEVPFDAGADPAVSQWMAACSSNGLYDYPYGDTFDPKACNGAELQPEECVAENKCRARDVATLPLCRGRDAPFDSIYDLSGNVGEWENSCDWGFSFHCRYRGGSSTGDHAFWVGLRCDFDSASLTRITSYDYNQWDVGFRCCKDVTGD